MKLPSFGRVIRQPDWQQPGDPVSALRAMVTRSNVQSHINGIGQTRLCYVLAEQLGEAFDGFGASAGPSGKRVVYPFTFPWTWIGEDRPMGLDVEVIGVVGDEGGGPLVLSYKVVPALSPFDDQQTAALLTGADVTSGANTDVVVGGTLIFTEPFSQAGIFMQHSVFDTGAVYTRRVAMLRLEVELNIPANDFAYIAQLYVREFPCQF